MYRRRDGTFDELLDSNGVLIPKYESFYSKEELASFNKKIETKIQPENKLIKTNLIRMFDINIETEIEIKKEKSCVSYDCALKRVKSCGLDRMLYTTEIVDIFDFCYQSDLYYSLLSGNTEWLALAWERKGKDLIVYERPENIFMEYLPGLNGNPALNIYNGRNIKCNNAQRFRIGNLPSSVSIPLENVSEEFYKYITGRSPHNYPIDLPKPVVILPEYFSIWPISFKIGFESMVLQGKDFCYYRGVEELKNKP